MKMKLAETFVRIIEKEGINATFGIPGAGINGVYKYLNTPDMRHYTMRHEEACVHAADGYFRACHEIALAICTAGPGATNFVTGLYTACIDSIPVLAVTGQANTWQLDKEPFQSVDIAEICRTITKKAWCVKDATQLPDILREAFQLMRSGRPGPVLIDFPLDMQNTEIDFDLDLYDPLPVEKPVPDDTKIVAAMSLLEQAQSPVIVMGGGVVLANAWERCIALGEILGVPIITTYMAKGAIPVEHPLNAGHVGIQVGQPIGNRVFLESDLVLAIGCRFSDRHTGNLQSYREGRKFIHIDISPLQIGRVFEPDLGIVADAGLAIEALFERANDNPCFPKGCDRIEKLARWRKELARKTDFGDIPIKPHRVFREINRVFAKDTIFTEGCGNTQIWSGQLQNIDQPMHYLPSGGAGTLGFEIPAAIGAKVARPEKFCVTIVGDFGFTFMGEEIAVAAANRIPITVVIINNSSLGLIRQNQRIAYDYEYCVDMPCNLDGTIDYVKVAQGYGCLAKRVSMPEELAVALEEAKCSERPYVIEVICDHDQFCDMGTDIRTIKSFI